MEFGKGPAANHSETNFHFSLSLLYGSQLFTCSRLQVSEERALIPLQAQQHRLPTAMSKGSVASKAGREWGPRRSQGAPRLLPVHFGPRSLHFTWPTWPSVVFIFMRWSCLLGQQPPRRWGDDSSEKMTRKTAQHKTAALPRAPGPQAWAASNSPPESVWSRTTRWPTALITNLDLGPVSPETPPRLRFQPWARPLCGKAFHSTRTRVSGQRKESSSVSSH